MKKAFPSASKLKKSDRIIPKFQGIFACVIPTFSLCKVSHSVQREAVVGILTAGVFCTFRQQDEARRTEERPHHITCAPGVFAEIL